MARRRPLEGQAHLEGRSRSNLGRRNSAEPRDAARRRVHISFHSKTGSIWRALVNPFAGICYPDRTWYRNGDHFPKETPGIIEIATRIPLGVGSADCGADGVKIYIK